MLSTNYRKRLESICKDIASGTEVSMSDMIWVQKLAKANTSARGDPDSSNHKRGFYKPEDVVEWFHQERSDDWRQRD